MTHYGFSSANNGEQPAWFCSREAAERFGVACGGLGEVETTAHALPGDVMDTPERPWTREVVAATLHNYTTGEAIRPATAAELAESIAAAQRDGGSGVIMVDGVSCYAE